MTENNYHDKKLGRGLSALLGDSKSKTNWENLSSTQSKGAMLIELIDVKKITAGLYQPRRNFNQDELHELAESIKENGVIQPILLRKAEDDHYEIVAGERRFRAAKMAELKEIPAIVKKINNHEALELAIIENVQREDLSLLEEAQGYKQLITDFSYTQEQVAKKTGKSRAHIANLIRLLSLPNKVQEMLEDNSISMGHARAIINSKNPIELANKIIQDELTVRDAENLARDEKISNLKNTPALIRTESKIKFINSSYITEFENKLTGLLESTVKIHYNQFKNSGKITIEFNNPDMLNYLVDKLK